jgi:pilus assembly protein CpaC
VRAKANFSITCLSALLFAAANLEAQNTAQPAAGASHQDSANELSVAVGKSVLVDTARPISRVAIGLGDVAEADAISPTEIMVNGKAPGETSLIIWDTGGGRQFFNVSVRASTTATSEALEAARRELRSEFPGQSLKVNLENGTVFLRGNVKDVASSDRAAKIAGTAGKVVNLLYVDVPAAKAQILLKVKFASVDRSREKQLGINLFSTGFGNTVAGITTGEFNPPTLTTAASGNTATFSNELNILAIYPGLNLGADIEALIQKSVVEVLSEPNIVAQSGKQASFLAGGEYPYPVVQGGGVGTPAAVSIEFKEYGVRLNFIATIKPSGIIHLQVAPEVSTLDFSNAVTLNGFEVPAIDTRKVQTEVDLGDGQSFVIGGLLDNRDTEAFNKVPFLGDIPILGKLFQSSQVTKTNTELMILVTPEVVTPIDVAATRPEIKFPNKFLPTNTGVPMNTPDAKTGTPAAAPASLPVETVVDSLRPEQPLVIQGASGTFGQGATTQGGSGTSTPPQQQ